MTVTEEATGQLTELAQAIRAARGKRTRRVFAVTIGCTEKTLYEWETCRSRPKERAHIRALRDAGVSIELLLADDESAAQGSVR